jgi:hypothetical protein
MPAALATITVLRPGTRHDERAFELFVVSTAEETPKAAAYIAAGSIDELASVVLALTDVMNGPRVD